MTNKTDRKQGLIGDLGIKKAVRVATTANITLEGLQTIDGVSLATNDRVLVKNQTTLTENGIYDASTGSWTRSLDFDGNGDFVNGTLIFVSDGSINTRRLFSTIVTDPVTIDSSSIQFNFAIAFGDAGLVASNNLSDVPNKSTARDNLGLEIGVDIPSYFDVSKYSSGNFYVDSSSSANTYTLIKASSLINPVNSFDTYYNGMTICFRANNANTGASIVNVNFAGVKNLLKADFSTALAAGDIPTDKDVEFRYNGTAFGLVTDVASGNVVQIVNTQTGAVATGTTLIPVDDTIPQNTEGDEYMSLAITPKNAANKLLIQVSFQSSNSASSNTQVVALFQDSVANALIAFTGPQTSSGQNTRANFTYYMTAGTTSATTFKVRAGGNVAGTVTFNGSGGSRQMGGVSNSSITITEYKA